MVDKIIIVGGGSSGWMSAAALINAFPDKDITVIESPDFPTVGVGESTLQFIRPWMYSLGIKDESWMPYCNATYKVSIRFENWDGKGGHFHYPFGNPVLSNDYGLDLYNFARLKEDVPNNEWAEVFFPGALMAENNLLVDKMQGWDIQKNSAYHFDASKFGQWLKNEYCIPRGVKLITDTVQEIDTDHNGIKCLHCYEAEHRANQALTADLWIDCTGFKGLLADAIGMKFRDYSYGLINDSAWATQLPENQPNVYHTNCTTLENGWVWNIPTKERTGTGYVFSSRYVSDEQALEEFKKHLKRDDELEFKLIKWKHGRREKFALKNVVTVGLSAGFIEPLESGGLFCTHEALKELIKVLQRGVFNGGDKNSFNYAIATRFDDFAAFVTMHYQYATRNDTPYWQDAHKFKLKNNNTLASFWENMHRDNEVNPAHNHFNSIAFGLGVNTVSNYDVEWEKLFGGIDMVDKGIQHRQELLVRQKAWLKQMRESSR